MKRMFRAAIFATVLPVFCANSAELAGQKSLQEAVFWFGAGYEGWFMQVLMEMKMQ